MSIRPGQTILPAASRVRSAWSCGLRPDAEDAVAADPEVGDLVEVLRRVDDAAVGDAEGGHGAYSKGGRSREESPRSERRSLMSDSPHPRSPAPCQRRDTACRRRFATCRRGGTGAGRHAPPACPGVRPQRRNRAVSRAYGAIISVGQPSTTRFIAVHGYSLSSATLTPESHGNVSWFPGYPVSIFLLRAASGWPQEVATMAAAQLACWGFWTYVFLLLQRRRIPAGMTALGCLLLAESAGRLLPGQPATPSRCF